MGHSCSAQSRQSPQSKRATEFAIRHLSGKLLSQSAHTQTQTACPLTPVAGGAIQLAIFPGSITGCIRLRTYSRSSIVGSHSDFRRFKLFRRDQVALDVEMMTSVFADVTVETRDAAETDVR